MLKVYDVEGFPNPARVRMALAEKNATEAVTFVPVDVMGGEHRGEAFKAKNPDATVPCMELECGTNVSRCTPIIEYIDGQFEGASLIGDTPKQRALTQMMNLRAEEGLVDAVGAYFHHATDGLGPELETDQVPAWGERQKGKATATMRYFNDVLADQTFVAGDVYTMADITLLAGLGFADFAGVSVPEGLNNLNEWRERVAARYEEN
ncbi:glutathione S-transferase family protein [Erythrobacter sp. W53]|uniref:glutathione S-transferase family protein n=1 Tax=Erythrobacter sp. W53 TaxID=3425947 RepID=UPI003D76905D